MKEIIYWISEKELSEVYSSLYWNDVEEEKKKEWWIGDGDYGKCQKYLESSGLLDEYSAAEHYIDSYEGKDLKVADLATGIGWTASLLSKNKKVSEVHAVEISKHRLKDLFEHSIKMLSAKDKKIFRYLGSFYNLKFDNNSMDIIFMSQAFHHADNPIKLLIECDRVLKKGGRIILTGEHFIGLKRILRRFFSVLLRQGKIVTNFYELFTTDPILGDHYYRLSDYYFLFKSMGYKIEHQLLSNGNIIYIADKYL